MRQVSVIKTRYMKNILQMWQSGDLCLLNLINFLNFIRLFNNKCMYLLFKFVLFQHESFLIDIKFFFLNCFIILSFCAIPHFNKAISVSFETSQQIQCSKQFLDF